MVSSKYRLERPYVNCGRPFGPGNPPAVPYACADGGLMSVRVATGELRRTCHQGTSAWECSWKLDLATSGEEVVMELSTQRAIYSSVNKPNSIFFNANHRLCFCEAGAGYIHLGDIISYVGGYPQGIVEDINEGGYWVAVHLLPETVLVFVQYDGKTTDKIIPLEDLRVFKIIEAKGTWLNKLL
jgi:hypothetical protein